MERKRRVKRIRPAPGRWGNWSRGEIPTSGQLFRTKEKYLRLLERHAADLWQYEWNENHTDHPWVAVHTLDRDTSPLESAAAGNNPRVRCFVNYGEMAQENVREEIVMRNAYGGKPGSQGGKTMLLSHKRGGAITVISPHMPSLAAEKHWKTPERLVSIVWSSREGHSQGGHLSAWHAEQ